MQRRFSLLAVLNVLTGVVLLGTSPLAAGAWRQLEPVPTEYPYGVYDFVVDTSGTPWAAVGDLMWWWDGREWNQATDGETPYTSGQCTGRLLGDSRRGAYMSQKPQHECEGTLLKLEAGKAHPVGTFRVDSYHVSPGIYVSRAGEVFNFGKRFLAVLRDGRWQSVETEMGSTREQLRIVDFGPEGPVVFVPQTVLKAAVWDGKAFHTEVALPEFEVDSPGNVRMARWGQDRILFWRHKSRLLGAVEVAGNRFEPVDTATLADQLGDPESIYGVATAPDGSLWVRVGRRELSDPNLVRIAPDGMVARHRARSVMWGTHPTHCYERSTLHARDGTFWFGILKGGIGSIRDGKIHAHDWRDGVLAADVRYIAEAPEGTVYAAAANPWHQVYRWDPEAAPDRSLTEYWDSIEHRIQRQSIADFEGSPWVFRLDRPGKVSQWDGTEWRDFDAPVDPDRLRYTVADDQGHLTVLELLPPRRSYVLGPDGVQQYGDLHEALVARVRAGARRFRTPDEDLMPPVVSRDGRLWLALSPSYRKHDLFAYFDGRWQPMDLDGVNAMGVDQTGRAVFITSDAVWTWRDGRFEKRADVDASKRSKFKVLGQYDRHGNVPLVDDPPEFLRRQFTLYAGLGGHRYYPMPWRALREGAGEFPQPISLDTGRPVRITYPRGAVPAPGGGAWLKETFRPPWRWLDDLVFRLDPLQTPAGPPVVGRRGGDRHGRRVGRDRGPSRRAADLLPPADARRADAESDRPQARGQVRPARALDLGRARAMRGGRVAGRPERLLAPTGRAWLPAVPHRAGQTRPAPGGDGPGRSGPPGAGDGPDGRGGRPPAPHALDRAAAGVPRRPRLGRAGGRRLDPSGRAAADRVAPGGWGLADAARGPAAPGCPVQQPGRRVRVPRGRGGRFCRRQAAGAEGGRRDAARRGDRAANRADPVRHRGRAKTGRRRPRGRTRGSGQIAPGEAR